MVPMDPYNLLYWEKLSIYKLKSAINIRERKVAMIDPGERNL
jgi:hypothetical protein